jgi:hypothetical protein
VPGTETAHSVKPAGVRARARVRRRPRLLRRPSLVLGPLLACLFFAGLGWVIALHPAQSSSSSSAAAPAAGFSQSSAASGSGSTSSAAASGPEAGAEGSFRVIKSGTSYRQATLAGQVHDTLAGQPAAGVTAPGPRSTAPVNGSVAPTYSSPTAQLRGCVLHFTGGKPPKLVDRATYQGTPAYIVASASRVWVVGLGCTSAKPELIESVALAG